MNSRGSFKEVPFYALEGWSYFLYIYAKREALRSRCKRRSVGAAGIGEELDTRIYLGYNGKGCDQSLGCVHEGLPTGTGLPCRGLHAEKDAINRANKAHDVIRIMVITLCPCMDCARAIVDNGIKEVCFEEPYGDGSSIEYLLSMGVNVTRILME